MSCVNPITTTWELIRVLSVPVILLPEQEKLRHMMEARPVLVEDVSGQRFQISAVREVMGTGAVLCIERKP